MATKKNEPQVVSTISDSVSTTSPPISASAAGYGVDIGAGNQASQYYASTGGSSANAVQNLAAGLANKGKPAYAGTFENQLSDIYDQIQNRQPFQYDVNNDALYQGYKDQYIQGGKLAMKDTMGQAAALTGGYGSTYGQQVGQQAYNAYLQNLTAMIPELYNMAYDKYRDEGNDLQNMYNLTADRRDTEYNQWRDSLSDYNYEEQKQYERQQYEDEKNYERQQDAYANALAYIKLGINPSDAELAAAGLTRDRANSLLKLYHPELFPVAPAAGGGGGGGGGGGSQPTAAQKKKTANDAAAASAANAAAAAAIAAGTAGLVPVRKPVTTPDLRNLFNTGTQR